MSSKSNDDHSSSSLSDNDNRRESDNRSRSRSRSRDKNRYRDENRSKDRRKNVIKIPDLSSELINFRNFLSLQQGNISKDIAEKAYENYKSKWEEKTNKAFYTEHKDDAWFQERYNPEVLEVFERERKEQVVKNSRDFMNLFSSGYYNDIDFSIKDFNQLGFICNERDEEFEELREIGTQKVATGIPINFQTVDINVSTKININSAPFYAFDPDINTIFIKAIPRNISKFDIFEVVGKLEGFQNITLSEPSRKLHFSRYCWISFANEESLKKAENAMNGLTIKTEPILFGYSSSRSRRVKILKKYPITRISKDAEVVRSLAAKLDEDCGVTGNILLQTEFPNSRKQLDTFLLYLRKVHAHDYYTNTSYLNQRALWLKIGRAFLRMEADYEQVPDFNTVFKQMQLAAEHIIKNGVQSIDYLAKLREEVEAMIVKHLIENQGGSVEQIKDRKIWECMYCNKKFKTCEFEAKHIIMKHEEAKEKHLNFVMEQAYIADPAKITSYSNNRDEKDLYRNRRGGAGGGGGFYRRGRGKDYKDLDDPDVMQAEKPNTKSINFLDI